AYSTSEDTIRNATLRANISLKGLPTGWKPVYADDFASAGSAWKGGIQQIGEGQISGIMENNAYDWLIPAAKPDTLFYAVPSVPGTGAPVLSDAYMAVDVDDLWSGEMRRAVMFRQKNGAA